MSRDTGPATRSYRGRLVGSFAGIALITLVVAGAVTLVFARSTARDAAFDDLREQSRAIRPFVAGGQLDPEARRALQEALRIQDAAIVRPGARGPLGELPPDLAGLELDTARLAAGETLSGEYGGVAYVVTPLPGGPGGRLEAPALVLTRELPGIDFGGLGPYLLVAAAASLVLALISALLLSARLARPLAATEAAALRVAAGDLSARVGAAGRVDRETAAVADAFDEMAAELERSRNLTREFLMSVSHDLRTPLTSVRGYAEAIQEGTAQGAAERRHAAAVIAAEARRLERLVADLLDLARLDARRFSLELQPVDPAGVTAAVAGGFEPTAAELGVELVVDTSPAPERQLDPERLGQVVANLVENALKYAAGRVTVTAGGGNGGGGDDGADVAWLEVADDGPGIPEEELPRVFERLYVGRGVVGRAVGTGLGLAIVHELVGAMGGTVTVDSPPGGGATFRVRFPAP